jgi:hypothetical protein
LRVLVGEELDPFVGPEETDYEGSPMHNTKRAWYPYAEADRRDAARAGGRPKMRPDHEPRCET